MAEFCTCGSIVINGQCTNKNCINRVASAKVPKVRKTAVKKVPKTPVKRASKCITYNLYETETEESIN